MDSADLTFIDIRTSLDLINYCSVCLSQKLDARLGGTPRPAMDSKSDKPTDHHRFSNSSTDSRRTSVTYHTAHFGPHLFPNTSFLDISPPSIGGEGIPPNPCTVSESPAYFKNHVPPSRLTGTFCHSVYVLATIFTPYWRDLDNQSYRLLNTRQMTSLQKAQCTNDIDRVVGICPTLRNLMSQKPAALLRF